jgi:hypothetical protein
VKSKLLAQGMENDVFICQRPGSNKARGARSVRCRQNNFQWLPWLTRCVQSSFHHLETTSINQLMSQPVCLKVHTETLDYQG